MIAPKTVPDLTDHKAIDDVAQRAGVHRGIVVRVIDALASSEEEKPYRVECRKCGRWSESDKDGVALRPWCLYAHCEWGR